MQDRLVLGIPRVGRISVKLAGVWKFLDTIPDRAVITSPCGGSAVTLNIIDNTVVLRGNPIGWLTGQNWIGTNDAYALTHRLLSALSENELVRWGRETTQAIDSDELNWHELAFAQYIDLGKDIDAFTDLLKSSYGAIAQHINPRHPISLHLYPGNGFILRNATTSLTGYNKYQKTFNENPSYSHRLVDPIAESLEHSLRIEATLKYNWFGKKRCLQHWRNNDWTATQTQVFEEFLGRRFHLEYVLSCPNVYADDYTRDWTPADARAFAFWKTGKVPDARTLRRLYSRHGFDGALSLEGHRNLLWTMLRPRSLHVPAQTDLRNVKTTVGHKLFARHQPLTEKLNAGANDKMLARADRLCGL